MKILLINPNTSQFVTEKVAAEARRVAGTGTEIVAVTGKNGPPIVSNRAEGALAATEAMNLAAEHVNGCDAVVLAISFDSGLSALREMLSIPVIGMTEAAMLAACTMGTRFAMVTFGSGAAPVYRELCHSYGLQTRLSEVVALSALSDPEMRDPLLILPRLASAVEQSVSERSTEVAILSGAIFAGITHAVADRVSVPVLNGIAEAVGIAEMLVRIKPTKAKRGSYRLPIAKTLQWPNSALTSLYASFDPPD